MKKTPRKHTPKAMSFDKREKMFAHWQHVNRNYLGTAKHFHIALTTLRRYALADEWEKRADAIEKSIKAGTDRAITSEAITNVKMAQAMLKKEVAAILDPKRPARGRIRDAVWLMQYIDGVLGNLPNSTTTFTELLTRAASEINNATTNATGNGAGDNNGDTVDTLANRLDNVLLGIRRLDSTARNRITGISVGGNGSSES